MARCCSLPGDYLSLSASGRGRRCELFLALGSGRSVLVGPASGPDTPLRHPRQVGEAFIRRLTWQVLALFRALRAGAALSHDSAIYR